MEHSGIYAAINGVSALAQWSIDEGYDVKEQIASNTGHGVNRHQGVYDWNGSYQAYGAIPHKMPGEYLAFQGYKAPDDTGDTANGEIASGNVYIESVAITWNFANNDPIMHTVNFGGNGDLTWSNGALIADASNPEDLPSCGGKISHYANPTLTDIDHVTQAVLTFTREAKTTVNTGTSSGGKCVTARRPGPAIDWTLAITTEDGNRDANLASGSIRNMRCFINATQFWDLEWGIFGKTTGVTANRMTGDIISQVHNVSMKGYNGGTAGKITAPGAGSNFWPFA